MFKRIALATDLLQRRIRALRIGLVEAHPWMPIFIILFLTYNFFEIGQVSSRDDWRSRDTLFDTHYVSVRGLGPSLCLNPYRLTPRFWPEKGPTTALSTEPSLSDASELWISIDGIL